MLVLSRKRDQRVKVEVGGVVVLDVLVIEIRGDTVRLGFAGPQSTVIHREEVWERIKEQEEQANNG